MPATDKKFHNIMTLEIAAKFIASPDFFVNQSSVFKLQSSVCELSFKCQMAHELRTQFPAKDATYHKC